MPAPTANHALSSDVMDEATFRQRAGALVAAVRNAVDALDPDQVEAVLEADVLKLVFPNGAPFVLNLQPPTREIWLAAEKNAWHFRSNGALWICKKNGDELLATLSRVLHARTGIVLPVGDFA